MLLLLVIKVHRLVKLVNSKVQQSSEVKRQSTRSSCGSFYWLVWMILQGADGEIIVASSDGGGSSELSGFKQLL